MIYSYNIPVWHAQDPTQYYDSYQRIIDNFKRCCNNIDVCFIDNTYITGPEVVKIVSQYPKSVVFNLVDPPYTWHYLRELVDSANCIFVGTDAPDIPTHFWLTHAHLKFPNYTEQDLLPKKMKSYLSYNFKPHEHRVNLIRHLTNRNLDHNGTITTHVNQSKHPHEMVLGLGELSIWQGHFLNIVNETVFRQHPELLMSEKILKPLLGLRPFIINGSPRYYDILEDWGIDFFDDIWPIQDMRQPADSLESLMHRNHSIICDVIQELASQDLQCLYQLLLPRLYRNQEKTKQLMLAEYERLCINNIKLNW